MNTEEKIVEIKNAIKIIKTITITEAARISEIIDEVTVLKATCEEILNIIKWQKRPVYVRDEK